MDAINIPKIFGVGTSHGVSNTHVSINAAGIKVKNAMKLSCIDDVSFGTLRVARSRMARPKTPINVMIDS